MVDLGEEVDGRGFEGVVGWEGEEAGEGAALKKKKGDRFVSLWRR